MNKHRLKNQIGPISPLDDNVIHSFRPILSSPPIHPSPPAEPVPSSTPSESVGMANHSSLERKSPRPADGCKTTALAATNVRSVRPSPPQPFRPPRLPRPFLHRRFPQLSSPTQH